jgi:DNA-directed RNA polymerase subunit RPC12/RpoP
MNWSPPLNYRQVESKLDGVTVYAPAPEEEKIPEAQTFKCPQCGATTQYDPSASSVACKHCGYVGAIQAQVVGQRAEESEFTMATMQKEIRGWGDERKELHCEACGADISIAAKELSATCPFCASNRVTVRTTSNDGLRPKFLIPFKIETNACGKLAKEWLGKGWMHPSDLASSAGSAKFVGMYMPFWTFDARIGAAWEAEVGYEKQESYYDHSDKEWKTRTVIDWRWENDSVTVPVNDMLGVGTTKASAVIQEKLYPFNLSDLTTYNPSFLAGWQAQSYDIPLPTAWDAAKARMREKAKSACYSDTSSSHVRSFSMKADFADESWRYILLPVFIAAYRFGDKTFQIMVNGQSGSVAGQKPVAWWKVWLVVIGIMTPGTCIGLIGIPLLFAGGVGLIPLIIGGILFVGGAIFSAYLFNQAFKAGEV